MTLRVDIIGTLHHKNILEVVILVSDEKLNIKIHDSIIVKTQLSTLTSVHFS